MDSNLIVKKNFLKNVTVVLVEPQGPMNIGSVCRAMMNFGFSNLRLVNPCYSYNSVDARKMALKAEKIIDNATLFLTLKDALADCQFAFATTRRTGKYREHFLLPAQSAEQILSFHEETRVSLVFGREDRGLHTEELDLCQSFITIPTDESFGSMNLAHAVTICLYELSNVICNKEKKSLNTLEPCTGIELESMYQHMRQTFVDINYLNPLNPDHILRAFRRIFGRAVLTKRDTQVLHGLCNKIDLLKKKDP